MTHKDYYRILGVGRDATQEEIQDAFHGLALEYHPDVNPDDPQAEERFKEISAAYDVLSDPDERSKYDLGIGAAWAHRAQTGGRPSGTASRQRAQYAWQARTNWQDRRQTNRGSRGFSAAWEERLRRR